MPFNSAITSGQKDSLRGTASIAPRWSGTFYLSVCPNTNVYTAQINQTAFGNAIAALTYDGGSGTLANVKVGHTVLISHTNDRTKAYFAGRVRIAPTSTVLYINESSADFQDDDYIFIVADFRILDKLARYESAVLYPDYETAFRALIPLIYGLRSAYIGSTSGASLAFSFAPSVVAATSGATISSHLWDVGDGTITVGSTTTQNITVTFPPGFRWISYRATDSGGRQSTRYLPVWVHDATETPTPLQIGDVQITGTLEDGFNATIPAFAGVSAILDNTLCVLWLDDERYNGTATNIVSNVMMVGRFRSEVNQTEYDTDGQQDAQVRFEIEGVQRQLARLEAKPLEILHSTAPDAFNEVNDLTIWRAIHLLATEYSTLHSLHSIYFDDVANTFEVFGLTTIDGNLLGAFNDLAVSINSRLVCNGAGQVEFVRDANIISEADRAALTTVLDFAEEDILDLSYSRPHTKDIGRLIGSGGSADVDTSTLVIADSIAPGVAQDAGEGGGNLHRQVLTAALGQDDAFDELNERAGHAYAQANARAEIVVTHPDGYHWLTPALDQWYTFTLSGDETARGVVLDNTTNWQLVAVDITHNLIEGTNEVQATYREETSGPPAQSLIYPPVMTATFDFPAFPPLPPFPAFEIPPFFLPEAPTLLTVPPILSGGSIPTGGSTAGRIPRNGNTLLAWSASRLYLTTDALLRSPPTWLDVTPPNAQGIKHAMFYGSKGALVSCEGGGWCYTFNFLTDDHNWQNFNYVCGGSSVGDGAWASTIGWQNDNTAEANGVSKVIAIKINIPSTFITSVTLTGRSVTAQNGPLTIAAYSQAADPCNGADLVFESATVAVNTDFSPLLNLNRTVTTLILRVQADDAPPLTGATGRPVIRSVTIRGTGKNPFAQTDNCAPTSAPTIFRCTDVFAKIPTWRGYAMSEVFERLGKTFTVGEVYAFDAGGEQVKRSTDSGATFGGSIALPISFGANAAFDPERIGVPTLGGTSGQVKMATTAGGAYSAYGSAMPAGAQPLAVFIPRYRFGASTSNIKTTTPEYLVASPSVGAAEALWKVTASGVTFTGITPTDGANKGLATGANCLAMMWYSGSIIVAVLSFGGTIKLARSTDAGSTWFLSSALAAQASWLTIRKSDLYNKQVFAANGANGVAYWSNIKAASPTFVNKLLPGSAVCIGVDVYA